MSQLSDMFSKSALLVLVLAPACTRASVPAASPSPILTQVDTPTTPSSAAPTSPTPPPPVSSDLVWVALENQEAIAEVDVNARRIVSKRRMSGAPHNITVAPNGTVAVTLPTAGRVALIQGRSVRNVHLGGSPHDVKAAAKSFLVANEGAARLHLLSLRGKWLGDIPLPANPHDLAVSHDQKRAWVSLDGSNRIAVVDIAERKILRLVSTTGRPHDLLFGPNGEVWVSDWRTGVSIYSQGGKRIGQVLPTVQVHHLAFSPDGRVAWLTDHADDRVFVLATRTRSVLASIPIGGAPHHVAVTPDGRWAVVANHDNGRLVVFDARTRRRVSAIRIGAGPHGVWAVP